uniref:SPRY domain-containing protein n=1 Tax=Rhizophagus irregularis (strain DAOM 181602 / DAOM 197198 / MUCL 43194) TaxID=747089 RepID=U9UZK5_RHIID
MRLDKSVISQSSSHHEWIRMKIPISGQGLFEWDIMVEKICEYFWVDICTEKGFNVDYDSWLGAQAYGWVFVKYGQTFKEKDRITVHLDMRTCSFSVNGKRYPIAFRNLPGKVYPAVSLRAP